MSCKAILFSLLLLLLASCGNNKKQAPFSGGTFSVCMNSSYIMRDPAKIVDYGTAQILGQIYEGLVSFHPKDLSVQPQLAKKFEIKKGGLLFEFTLRDKVLFQDFGSSKKYRELTVEDVVFSIKRACRPDKMGNPSAAYSLVYRDKLKGADDFFHGKSKSISGITIKGKRVSLELIRPDFNFLEKLSQTCCVILSKKLHSEKGNFIGTGPFILQSEFESPLNLKLIKNPDYYLYDQNGCALPYLDTLEFIILSKKLEQLDMFEQKKLDVILGLPASRIKEMIEGRIEDFNSQPPVFYLHNSAILRTDYYYFDMTDPRFKDPLVRQAFNYAVDKNRIGQNVLQNQYYEVGDYGIVPPLKRLFRGYDFEGVKKNAYTYNPEKAKTLLAQAGFPNGENFGTVTLRFNIDDVHSAVADEFAKQIWTNLGIRVYIDGSGYQQLSKDHVTGNGDIFRTAWVADYPNPETFLQNFAGKFVPENKNIPSLLNNARYINPKYDEYCDKAMKSVKLKERRAYFSKAEIELMKDPPIIPLWYSGELCVTYANVRNFHINSLNLFDFRRVYIKEWTKEEYQNSKTRKS
jgi:oligopeptide transport system substrate-binding protein